MLAPGAISHHSDAFGQAAATAATGQVQLDPAEFADYDNAVNKQTTPQTQAPALEAYLAKYPKSTVKADVLQRLMIAYSQLPTEHAIEITPYDSWPAMGSCTRRSTWPSGGKRTRPSTAGTKDFCPRNCTTLRCTRACPGARRTAR